MRRLRDLTSLDFLESIETLAVGVDRVHQMHGGLTREKLQALALSYNSSIESPAIGTWKNTFDKVARGCR